MSLFGSSNSSSDSAAASSPIPRTRAPPAHTDEIANALDLDSAAVDWIKAGNMSKDDPVLVLYFEKPFYDLPNWSEKKAAVIGVLLASGGKRIGDNVVQFDEWTQMFCARGAMERDYPSVFHAKFPDRVGGPGIDSTPKITTTVITWFSDKTNALTTVPYQFFLV